MAKAHIKWDDIDRFAVDLKKAKQSRMSDILRGMKDALLLLDAETQRNLRGGNPLNIGTGKLSTSVRGSDIKVSGREGHRKYKAEFGVIGSRSSKGPGFYGRVLEWGAQTPGHIVKPKKPGGWLVFEVKQKGKKQSVKLGGKKISFQSDKTLVFAKQVVMKPKPWLTPAFNKKRAGMKKILEEAGAKVVKDLSKK